METRMFDIDSSFPSEQGPKEHAQEDTTKIEQPNDAQEGLKTEINTLKNDLLRAMAETENVRKRAQKDREDALKYATSNFARDLTSISENFRRALESVPKEEVVLNASFKSFCEGVDMIERELLSAFERHGIKRIMPQQGDKFDHNLHQAMFEVEDDSKPVGTILETLQAGYTLHDRLLKPAFVGVSKAKSGIPNT